MDTIEEIDDIDVPPQIPPDDRLLDALLGGVEFVDEYDGSLCNVRVVYRGTLTNYCVVHRDELVRTHQEHTALAGADRGIYLRDPTPTLIILYGLQPLRDCVSTLFSDCLTEHPPECGLDGPGELPLKPRQILFLDDPGFPEATNRPDAAKKFISFMDIREEALYSTLYLRPPSLKDSVGHGIQEETVPSIELRIPFSLEFLFQIPIDEVLLQRGYHDDVPTVLVVHVVYDILCNELSHRICLPGPGWECYELESCLVRVCYPSEESFHG